MGCMHFQLHDSLPDFVIPARIACRAGRRAYFLFVILFTSHTMTQSHGMTLQISINLLIFQLSLPP
jgi:hypothetical protein